LAVTAHIRANIWEGNKAYCSEEMEDSRSLNGIDARTWAAPVLEHLREGGEIGWVFLYEEDPADHARVSYRRRGHGGAEIQGGVLHLSFRTGSKGSVLHLASHARTSRSC
jgi:hypothetical protein